jgi:hypothetical protein
MKKNVLFLSTLLAVSLTVGIHAQQQSTIKKSAKIVGRFLEASAGLALGAYSLYTLKPDFFKDFHTYVNVQLDNTLTPSLNKFLV